MAKRKKKTKKHGKKKKIKKQYKELVRVANAYGHQGDFEVIEEEEGD